MPATCLLSRLGSDLAGATHRRRLMAVWWAVRSLLGTGSLTVTGLGRGAGGPVAPKHSIKRADRLIGNPLLRADHDIYCRWIASLVVHPDLPTPILVDWTTLTGGSRALVAAVPVSGRAVPILFEVHSEESHGSTAVERAFLERLARILPESCVPVLITDAGFRSDWLMDARKLGFEFVGRLAGYVKVDVDGTWRTVEEVASEADSASRDFGPSVVAKSRRVKARVVRAPKAGPTRRKRRRKRPTSHSNKKARLSAKTPWVLATSLDLPKREVLALYAQRMQIEETFRTQKSPRFGWCLTWGRCSTELRLENLLLLASLATLVLVLVGRILERRGVQRGFQANTVKRRALSLITLARAFLASEQAHRVTPSMVARESARLAQEIPLLWRSGDA